MAATYTIKYLDDYLRAEKTGRPGHTNEQGKKKMILSAEGGKTSRPGL
jgi:hypothetical protein